jgi:hypothetical protein
MGRKARLFVSCAAAAVFLASCGSAYQESDALSTAPTREPIGLNVAPERTDTRISIDADAEQAIVQVFSPSGIGGANIEVTSAALPRKIVLLFHLRGLEELLFTYGDTIVTARISSAGDKAIRQSYQGGGQSGAQEQSIAEASPYWMPIRIVPSGAAATPAPQEGYIEVEAPADFIAHAQRKCSIHWIDFYR